MVWDVQVWCEVFGQVGGEQCVEDDVDVYYVGDVFLQWCGQCFGVCWCLLEGLGVDVQVYVLGDFCVLQGEG